MIAEALLSRLERVRECGPGRWIACCPAHDDKSPTLNIRELDDRILIHCFAGCGPLDVLEAVGLDFSALYPPRPQGAHRYPKVPPVPYADALRCIGSETWVVLIAAGKSERGEAFTPDEIQRLVLAQSRIATALQVTGAWR